MKRLIAPALLLCLLALPISGCGSGNETSSTGEVPEKVASAMADRGASGQALANGWFGLLAATGSGTGTVTATPEEVRAGAELVKSYLDPAFQLQRASGERYLASNYVPTDIDRFKVSNVVVTNPREGVKVVRYVVRTPGATTPDSSTVLSSKALPRLSVFRWDEGSGHWMIVSHANFNTPVAAICDRKPVAVTKEKPDTSAEDVKTGETLVNEWRDITLGKTKKSVLDPANQIQLADGQGWPNPNGEKIKWAPARAYESRDIAITQNEDLLVASYDAVVSDLSVEGATYRSAASPRLLTYSRNDQGDWKMIALANFTVPEKVPAGVKCVK
ncbi:MAG: hypothetical protein FGM34_10220 [Solirubrobacteraceae bacterium]|nr:hypothetical protein [Solirubrobacteraceae bacterium]